MKKRFTRLLKGSSSNPDLPVAGGSQLSPPSGDRSHRGLSKFHPKSWRKSTNPSALSAQHSPNPASSSAQDLLPARIGQDPLPLVVPAPKSDPDQSANSSTAKVELLDPKLKERIADATRGEGDMKNISGVTRNIASSNNHLQSVPSAIDTTSKILDSLRLFTSVADGLANVHPYVQAVLSIFTSASKMILDQADRDAAVNDLLAKISDVYA
ncbi:uncharacterized protein EDB91DRAFT_1340010, partial [Suillus paluster]|uniref:uncharacterized protein n=1 Tax=Suillus paluster TaxID=48578 RepID=UPI001B875601